MLGWAIPARGQRRPGTRRSPVATVVSFAASLPLLTSTAIAAFVTLLVAQALGAPLAGSIATVIACGTILLFGLPHGTLDLAIIRREQGLGPRAMRVLLLAYLGLAAGMAALWQVAPVAALSLFIVIAVLHFAEDWDELGSAFLAQGLAIATLSAPTLLHLEAIEQLFIAVSGSGQAALVADLLLLIAPTSLAVASVAIWVLAKAGRRAQGITTAVALAGMVLLSPVVGFALYFCLHHSPQQLKIAIERAAGVRRSWSTIAALTLAALGLSAALFASELRPGLSDQFVAASFMTLSLLTVPHMLVPSIVARRRPATAAGSSLSFDPRRK